MAALLNSVSELGVVCVYDGKGYGVRWFLNHLTSFHSSRVPTISTIEDIKNLFNTIILQKHALKKITSNFDDFSTILNLEIKDIKENMVYDSYLKNYINTLDAPLPDSVSLYYNKNLSSLYTDFKLRNGFSPDEIIAKQNSLKGVLEPFSTQGNLEMLKRAGFVDVITVMKYGCFEGFLAIK